jgi:AcrR family transcriptional regulator
MPRRGYRHGNLPNALRAAARAILDEAGPDGVGLRETARRVGVSATAAYRHFANKEDLLASVAAEGFRELAAAMERGATGSDPLGRVGLAYLDFASQKRGLFRLMFGPILVERAKYPELNEATSAVFGLLQRVAVSADQWPCEDDVAGMAAWGLVMACSTASSPRRAQGGPANEILVRNALEVGSDSPKPPSVRRPIKGRAHTFRPPRSSESSPAESTPLADELSAASSQPSSMRLRSA